MKKICWFAQLLGALIFGTPSAHASLVRVISNTGWSSGTGTGGFEDVPFQDVERAIVILTYDTSIPDQNGSPDFGLYPNAITDFFMLVEQETRDDLVFVLNGPSEIRVGNDGGGSPSMGFKVSTREAFGSFQDMTFTWAYVFGTAIENIGDRLPLPSSFNDFDGFGFVGTGVGSGGFSVSETDFFTAPRAFFVSLPGSIALVALGLLLLGWRRLAKGPSHQRLERSLGQAA